MPQSTDFTDHYAVLGVPPASSTEEIRAKYLELATQHHPDKVIHTIQDDVHMAVSSAFFSQITYSYSILKNPKLRAQFDAECRLTMSLCSKCNGAGVVLAQKGFGHAVKRSCTSCNGAGRTPKRSI